MVEQARHVNYSLASESPVSLPLPGSQREVIISSRNGGIIIECGGVRLNPAELEFLYSQSHQDRIGKISGLRRRDRIKGIQDRNTMLIWDQKGRRPNWKEIETLAKQYGLLDPIFVSHLFQDILKAR